jgi:hypothetical protein
MNDTILTSRERQVLVSMMTQRLLSAEEKCLFFKLGGEDCKNISLKTGDVIQTFEIFEKDLKDNKYGLICRMFEMIKRTLDEQDIPLKYAYLDCKRIQVEGQQVIQYQLIFNTMVMAVNKKDLSLSQVNLPALFKSLNYHSHQ